jgi:pimeloyl-ACP methyl ester carboxylesterase
MPYFTTRDGLEIAYHVWGTPGPRPPVLLHHGYISNTTNNWVTPGVVSALTDAGRQVVALDARGHGASSKPHDPRWYGEDKMAQDVSQLIDRLGASQVDLVGYSMGAFVALIVASQDARIRRLVIGGVGGSLVGRDALEQRRATLPVIAAALRTPDPATTTNPAVQAFRAFADYVGGDREALAACAEGGIATPIPFDRIAAPTLLIVGDSDILAAAPEALAAAIPHAQVLILSGDHLGAVRNSRFAPAIVEFVAQ